jgi:hypothetical protein
MKDVLSLATFAIGAQCVVTFVTTSSLPLLQSRRRWRVIASSALRINVRFAATYITKLPKREHDTFAWRAAIESRNRRRRVLPSHRVCQT